MRLNLSPREDGKTNKEYNWEWWSKGSPALNGEYLAVDTETQLIEGPLHVPLASLGMVWDGRLLYAIHPTQFSDFVKVHANKKWVGHNLSFDFWVIYNQVDSVAKRMLWNLGDKSLLHDSQVLDQLVQLSSGQFRMARGGFSDKEGKVYPTNLGVLASECDTVNIDKTDTYRLRFGELVGMSAETMMQHPEWEGFINYALPDVIATFDAYKSVRAKAIAAMMKVGYGKTKNYEILPDALSKYGPLSEAIQVRASIALAKLSLAPLPIDLEARQKYEDEERVIIQEVLDYIELTYPDMLRRHSDKARAFDPGSYKIAAKTGLPCFNNGTLKEVLVAEAKRMKVPVIMSEGKLKGVSTSAKSWAQHVEKSDFIKRWVTLETHAKNLQFLVELKAPEVYSKYDLLKKTGRTGASAHTFKKKKTVPSVNIQQIPRNVLMRSLFTCDPSTMMSCIDYGYLELRTLAATCRGKYGYSVLGDVIEKHYKTGGMDPHENMACVMSAIDEKTYKLLPKEEQKKRRQASKAVNFGNPGGLGKMKLVAYAAANYNVIMTETEAVAAKQSWFKAYPEMRRHLEDFTYVALAYNTDTPPHYIQDVFPETSKWTSPLRTIKDCLFKKQPLPKLEYAQLYSLLLNKRKDLLQYLEDSTQWVKLHDELFLYRACTLTGRIKGRSGYTDGCNAPFQGLAADGGKEALWRLMFLGYDVRAFIHDAFITFLPEKTAERDAKKVEEIMCREMEKIIKHNVPVAAEGVLGKCWVK